MVWLELNYKDSVKCGYADEDELSEAHNQCDLTYLIKVNRQVVTILHETVYPKGSNPTKGRILNICAESAACRLRIFFPSSFFFSQIFFPSFFFLDETARHCNVGAFCQGSTDRDTRRQDSLTYHIIPHIILTSVSCGTRFSLS